MSVRVDLGERSYSVHIGPGQLARAGEIVRGALKSPPKRIFVAVDSGVPTNAVSRAAASLTDAGYEVVNVTIPGGESCKSLNKLEALLAHIAITRIERSDLIVVIGGGAVCDLVGFAASVYRRGVQVVHCPTTLLAMVDASVGGKTGVNLTVGGSLKKNMVGAFWQPAAVIADVSVLTSLPARELRAGLAECIKHGLISSHASDPAILDWTESNLPALLKLEPQALAELVQRNVAIKAAIVADDEREDAPDADGGRALLNLGHTFGHVIEALPGVSAEAAPAPLLHGECVALGLVAASATGEALGLSPRGAAERVLRILTQAGLPTTARGLPETDRLIDLMKDDKKSTGGSLRIIVPTDSGRAKVVRNPDPQAIAKGWNRIRAQ